ncbi:ankyrin repeat domain-containing protein 12-like isoform X4 [Biomphalaria pfeifferi]|uniref:Ankyrin repeat domain-containing protein 12-like isoform X4 n=1 Tax=Biomphalaria pfeifferi TaxID=112525 RepID=A0AAD8FDS9_BIOPF|nr:ankyrin repeat domain-containing protein 12-like isoform X4 [Biomphalaria pfeifferi]
MSDILSNAIRAGEFKKIRRLLDSQDKTILHYVQEKPVLPLAVVYKQLNIVKLLLERNANVNAVGNDGDTAIHAAVKKEDLEVLKLLTERHCDLNVLNAHRLTALMIAVEKGFLDIAVFLCEKGADINAVGHKGNTALHLAAKKGKIEMVRLLLRHRGNIDSQNSEGVTAVFIAVNSKSEDMLKLLGLMGADLSIKQNDGTTVIIQAAKSGNVNGVRCLLEHYNDKLLHDINAFDKQGQNALMYATNERYIEIVKILINHGANVNLQNPNNGQTCLHLGVLNDDSEVVEVLIAAGACLNVVNQNLETPISRANNFIKRVLLKAGAYECGQSQIGMPVFHREGSIHSDLSNPIHNESSCHSIEIDTDTNDETHLIQQFRFSIEEADAPYDLKETEVSYDSQGNEHQPKNSEKIKSLIDKHRFSKKFIKALNDFTNKFVESYSSTSRTGSVCTTGSTVTLSEQMKITIHMATNVIIGDNIKLHCSPRPSSVSGGSTKTLTHYDQILKEADDELEFMEMFKRNVPGTIEKSIDDISEPIATSSDSNLEPTATAENSNLEPMETASNSNIEPMATVSKSNLEPTATASNSNLEPMAKSKNNIPEPKASTVKNIPEPMATSRNNISEYFLEDIEVDIGGSVSGSNVDGGSASRGAVSGGSVNRNSDASIGNNAGTKPKKTFGSTWSPLDLRATDSASARSGSLPGRSSANKSRNTLSRELEKTADASESASLTTIERKESRSEEASTTENEKVDETSTDINVSM